MSLENIRFPRAHMALRDGYFYYFDERNNTLNKKVCSGAPAFVWPLEATLGVNQVKAVEYDGNFFWTLQQGPTIYDSIIKKWKIEDYICKVVDTLDLSSTADINFCCSTFSLEYYTTTLAASVPSRTSSITLNDCYNKVEIGSILTLGPNADGVYEDVTITGTLAAPNEFGLDFYTFNDYAVDTNVYFAKSVWLVNSYYYTQISGSLYEVSLLDTEIKTVVLDTDFERVQASCFYDDGSNQYILYIFGTTLHFYNIITRSNEKSMLIDNLKSDQATTIPVYAIGVEGATIYRLQLDASYYGTDYKWATYNYQVSTFRPFVDSMSIDVAPKILPSTGINVATVTISVRDQYNAPLQLKPVWVEDSDSTGFITTSEVYTDLYGVATTYYKAGLVPASVTIMGLATQYD